MNQLKGTPFVFYSQGLTLRPVEIKGQTEFFVEGHVSTSDLDLVNDIVTKGCLDDMDTQFKDGNIKLDYEHEAFRAETKEESISARTRMPLGKAAAHKRDHGSWVSFQLNKSWKKFDENGNVTMNFDELKAAIKNEYLDAFSIAFIPLKTTYKTINGVKTRLLEKVLLLNVALTGNPVNPYANASMGSVMAKSMASLKTVDRTKKKAYSKDGAHAHTENDPIGEHNHPEIEKEVSRLWDSVFEVEERIANRMESRISELSEGGIGVKSIQGLNSNQDKKKVGGNMADDENKSGSDADPSAEEKKSNEELKTLLAELKTSVDAQAADFKSLKEASEKSAVDLKANADAIAEINKVLDAARPKQIKADPNEGAPSGEELKANMSGPLDMIGR